MRLIYKPVWLADETDLQAFRSSIDSLLAEMPWYRVVASFRKPRPDAHATTPDDEIAKQLASQKQDFFFVAAQDLRGLFDYIEKIDRLEIFVATERFADMNEIGYYLFFTVRGIKKPEVSKSGCVELVGS